MRKVRVFWGNILFKLCRNKGFNLRGITNEGMIMEYLSRWWSCIHRQTYLSFKYLFYNRWVLRNTLSWVKHWRCLRKRGIWLLDLEVQSYQNGQERAHRGNLELAITSIWSSDAPSVIAFGSSVHKPRSGIILINLSAWTKELKSFWP